MTVNFQIGQCRIVTEVDRTKKFYNGLPRISENCSCKDCSYFETELIKKKIRLFEILKKMGVDLAKQPNINSDRVFSGGETGKYQKSFNGSYKIYGRLKKTQKSTQMINGEGQLESVDFYESEKDSCIQYKIKQDSNDQLTIDFFIECEKK